MPSNLIRRGDVYYFRVRVPKEFVAAYGRRIVSLSLFTSDAKLAIPPARERAVELERELQTLREQASVRVDSTPKGSPSTGRVIATTTIAARLGPKLPATARRMARAQVARDQFMARVVEAHSARGVVLLAGNGHVRSDVGVPRWLTPGTRSLSEAIGVLESGSDSQGTFDRVVHTVAQPREDPCLAMCSRAPAPTSDPR